MVKVFGEEVEAQPEQGRNTLKFLRPAPTAPRFPLQLANKSPGKGGKQKHMVPTASSAEIIQPRETTSQSAHILRSKHRNASVFGVPATRQN